jgi:hypothetical protein
MNIFIIRKKEPLLKNPWNLTDLNNLKDYLFKFEFPDACSAG